MFSERFGPCCLLFLLGLGACSVREDRSVCPSLVVLDCSGVDAGALMVLGCD